MLRHGFRRFHRWLLVVLALCCAPAGSSARADLILGNLTGNDLNAFPLYSTSRKAVSFTMGSQSYLLDDVVLRLDYGTGTPIVELRNDVGGSSPGDTVLTTFNTPGINGGGIQDYTFTPTSSFTLAANTKYWMYVYGSGADFSQSSFWYRSSANSAPAGPGATFDIYSDTNNGGSSWNTNSTTYNKFEVHGSVPEPSSLWLVAAAGAAAVRRRRRRT